MRKTNDNKYLALRLMGSQEIEKIKIEHPIDTLEIKFNKFNSINTPNHKLFIITEDDQKNEEDKNSFNQKISQDSRNIKKQPIKISDCEINIKK